MADLLADGVDWLADQLTDNVSQEITYSDGTNSVTLDATIGRSEHEAVNASDGTVVITESTDFIVKAAELILDSSVVEPSRGDTVSRTIGSKTHTYTVMPLDVGGDVYRYSDRNETILRIHTKETSET